MSSNSPNTAFVPLISVIVVLYNEAKHIVHCIQSIEAQFEPGDAWELVLVDGQSTDNSVALIEAYFAQKKGVHWQLISNPKKTLATGWNLGIQHARGRYMVRPDAHAALHPGYIKGALEILEQRPEIGAVGGTLETIGKGFWGRVIQEALSSPVGVGNSGFRTGAKSGEADTAVYGLYRREVFEQAGLFDERLVRHQDTEFHGRVQASGWKFWLQNTIQADYFCRDTPASLLTQMRRIGYYLPDLLGLKHGGLRPRHLAPFAFFAGCAGLLIIGYWLALAFWLGVGALALYVLAVVVAAGSRLSKGPAMLLITVLIPAMHLAYAWGTFTGLLRQVGRAKSASSAPSLTHGAG